MPNHLKDDPTHTALLRHSFENDVKRRTNKLKRRVREAIVTKDVFGLRLGTGPSIMKGGLQLNTQYAFQTDPEKVDGFRKWFQQQVDEGYLETPEGTDPKRPWTAKYVESAYRKGIVAGWIGDKIGKGKAKKGKKGRSPAKEMNQAEFLEKSMAGPVAVRQLEALGTRSFEHMRGMTQKMSEGLSAELMEGFANGYGPSKIAKNIENNIDGLTRRRGLVIARTEIIHAHAEGQLDSFEQQGISEVTAEVEFSTAEDGKVCPRCAAMQGVKMTIAKARGVIPVHPSCRCAWLAVIAGLKEAEAMADAMGDGIYDTDAAMRWTPDQINEIDDRLEVAEGALDDVRALIKALTSDLMSILKPALRTYGDVINHCARCGVSIGKDGQIVMNVEKETHHHTNGELCDVCKKKLELQNALKQKAELEAEVVTAKKKKKLTEEDLSAMIAVALEDGTLSAQEIANTIGINNVNTVRLHLKKMAEQGLVKKEGKTWVVIGKVSVKASTETAVEVPKKAVAQKTPKKSSADKIAEAVGPEPKTALEIATASGVNLNKVRLHLKWMQKRGLVKKDGKKWVSTSVLQVEPAPVEIPKTPLKPEQTFFSVEDLDNADFSSVWKKPKGGLSQSYGVVLFDDEGRVLLREPTNHFGGVHWTFAKGGGKLPASTALKELGEETGHTADIYDFLPDDYPSGYSKTNYFLGKSTGRDPDLMDDETSDLQWMSYEDARAAIMKGTDAAAVKRDLAVLDAAYKQHNAGDNSQLADIVGVKPKTWYEAMKTATVTEEVGPVSVSPAIALPVEPENDATAGVDDPLAAFAANDEVVAQILVAQKAKADALKLMEASAKHIAEVGDDVDNIEETMQQTKAAYEKWKTEEASIDDLESLHGSPTYTKEQLLVLITAAEDDVVNSRTAMEWADAAYEFGYAGNRHEFNRFAKEAAAEMHAHAVAKLKYLTTTEMKWTLQMADEMETAEALESEKRKKAFDDSALEEDDYFPDEQDAVDEADKKFMQVSKDLASIEKQMGFADPGTSEYRLLSEQWTTANFEMDEATAALQEAQRKLDDKKAAYAAKKAGGTGPDEVEQAMPFQPASKVEIPELTAAKIKLEELTKKKDDAFKRKEAAQRTGKHAYDWNSYDAEYFTAYTAWQKQDKLVSAIEKGEKIPFETQLQMAKEQHGFSDEDFSMINDPSDPILHGPAVAKYAKKAGIDDWEEHDWDNWEEVMSKAGQYADPGVTPNLVAQMKALNEVIAEKKAKKAQQTKEPELLVEEKILIKRQKILEKAKASAAELEKTARESKQAWEEAIRKHKTAQKEWQAAMAKFKEAQEIGNADFIEEAQAMKDRAGAVYEQAQVEVNALWSIKMEAVLKAQQAQNNIPWKEKKVEKAQKAVEAAKAQQTLDLINSVPELKALHKEVEEAKMLAEGLRSRQQELTHAYEAMEQGSEEQAEAYASLKKVEDQGYAATQAYKKVKLQEDEAVEAEMWVVLQEKLHEARKIESKHMDDYAELIATEDEEATEKAHLAWKEAEAKINQIKKAEQALGAGAAKNGAVLLAKKEAEKAQAAAQTPSYQPSTADSALTPGVKVTPKPVTKIEKAQFDVDEALAQAAAVNAEAIALGETNATPEQKAAMQEKVKEAWRKVGLAKKTLRDGGGTMEGAPLPTPPTMTPEELDTAGKKIMGASTVVDAKKVWDDAKEEASAAWKAYESGNYDDGPDEAYQKYTNIKKKAEQAEQAYLDAVVKKAQEVAPPPAPLDAVDEEMLQMDLEDAERAIEAEIKVAQEEEDHLDAVWKSKTEAANTAEAGLAATAKAWKKKSKASQKGEAWEAYLAERAKISAMWEEANEAQMQAAFAEKKKEDLKKKLGAAQKSGDAQVKSILAKKKAMEEEAKAAQAEYQKADDALMAELGIEPWKPAAPAKPEDDPKAPGYAEKKARQKAQEAADKAAKAHAIAEAKKKVAADEVGALSLSGKPEEVAGAKKKYDKAKAEEVKASIAAEEAKQKKQKEEQRQKEAKELEKAQASLAAVEAKIAEARAKYKAEMEKAGQATATAYEANAKASKEFLQANTEEAQAFDAYSAAISKSNAEGVFQSKELGQQKKKWLEAFKKKEAAQKAWEEAAQKHQQVFDAEEKLKAKIKAKQEKQTAPLEKEKAKAEAVHAAALAKKKNITTEADKEASAEEQKKKKAETAAKLKSGQMMFCADGDNALLDVPIEFEVTDSSLGGSTGAKKVKVSGVDDYVMKTYSDGGKDTQAENEYLSNNIYRAVIKEGAPQSRLAVVHNKGRKETAVLGRYVEGAKPIGGLKGEELEKAKKKAQRGFVLDAWLGNWDSVGMTGDNMLVTADGDVVRIDNGGSLLYRAQGGLKGDAFGPEVNELSDLRNAKKNPSASKIFAGVTDQHIIDQVGELEYRIAKAGSMRKFLEGAGLNNIADPNKRQQIATTLQQRFSYLQKERDKRVAANKAARLEKMRTQRPAVIPLTAEARVLYTQRPKDNTQAIGDVGQLNLAVIKAKSNLRVKERNGIEAFTGNASTSINQRQLRAARTGEGSDEYTKQIDDGLAKLPGFSGIAIRGESNSPMGLFDKCKSGDYGYVHWTCAASSSVRPGSEFGSTNGICYIIRTKGKRNGYVEEISTHSHEKEALFMSDTVFRVVGYAEAEARTEGTGHHRRFIVMDEMADGELPPEKGNPVKVDANELWSCVKNDAKRAGSTSKGEVAGMGVDGLLAKAEKGKGLITR